MAWSTACWRDESAEVGRAGIEVLDEGPAHPATVQPQADLPIADLWREDSSSQVPQHASRCFIGRNIWGTK